MENILVLKQHEKHLGTYDLNIINKNVFDIEINKINNLVKTYIRHHHVHISNYKKQLEFLNNYSKCIFCDTQASYKFCDDNTIKVCWAHSQ